VLQRGGRRLRKCAALCLSLSALMCPSHSHKLPPRSEKAYRRESTITEHSNRRWYDAALARHLHARTCKVSISLVLARAPFTCRRRHCTQGPATAVAVADHPRSPRGWARAGACLRRQGHEEREAACCGHAAAAPRHTRRRHAECSRAGVFPGAIYAGIINVHGVNILDQVSSWACHSSSSHRG